MDRAEPRTVSRVAVCYPRIRTRIRKGSRVASEHSVHSSYRQALLEHVFTGAIMSHMWLHGMERIEILKPQVDNSGYDIVLEASGVVRHVQLKASHRQSATSRVNIHRMLGEKLSGCVIWILFDPANLELGPFLWFGGIPGERLPDLGSCPAATHTRHDAQGIRPERPNIRALPKRAFSSIDTIEELVDRLFRSGAPAGPLTHDHPNDANPSV